MSEYTPEQFIEMREACIGDGFSIHSMIYKMLTVAATNCERLAECKHWLKDGQTPAERLEANHKESIALLGLLKKEKQRVEILEAAAIWITANALPASIQTAISNLEDAAKEKARYKPPHSQDEDPKIYDAELEGFRTNLEDAIAAYINSALEQANAALKSHKERMEAKPVEHVAWLRFTDGGSYADSRYARIVVCDSDSPGAFKVYRSVVTGRDEDRKLGAGHQQLLFELREAMKRIAQCEDAPDIDPTGETQWGLHCGVEDRGCTGKYDGADYGYTQGVERAIEWAKGEAETALAKYDEAVK